MDLHPSPLPQLGSPCHFTPCVAHFHSPLAGGATMISLIIQSQCGLTVKSHLAFMYSFWNGPRLMMGYTNERGQKKKNLSIQADIQRNSIEWVVIASSRETVYAKMILDEILQWILNSLPWSHIVWCSLYPSTAFWQDEAEPGLISNVSWTVFNSSYSFYPALNFLHVSCMVKSYVSMRFLTSGLNEQIEGRSNHLGIKTNAQVGPGWR